MTLISHTQRFHDLYYADNDAQSENVNSWHEQFCNPYGLIPFGYRARTERPFEHMRAMGMARLNGLAPLSCARTQLVLIRIMHSYKLK